MIRITARTLHGVTVGRALSTNFGASGGTIGRAATNQLILEDPDRTVSRVHAQVLVRDGQYFIIDRGSNPMLCDGRPLGSGNEVRLLGGERLVIGGFELSVEGQDENGAASSPGSAGVAPSVAHAALASADDPFADLLAGLGAPAPQARPAPAPAPVSRPGDAAAHALPDPFGADASAPAPADAAMSGDPFADLLAPMHDSGSGQARGSRNNAALNDFSDLGGPPAPSRSSDIDALFGPSVGLGGDPLDLSPLADPLRQPNTASSADPLAAFGTAAAPTAAPRADHVPIGNFGFEPPGRQAPRALTAAQKPPPSSSPAAQAAVAPMAFDDQTGLPLATGTTAPADDLFGALLGGLDGESPDFEAPILASPLPRPPQAPAPPASAPAPAHAAVAPVAVATSSALVAARTPHRDEGAAHTYAASDAELLAAFLRGLAATHQPPTSLTPALMERVGAMLRIATEGTLQLLLTRQEFKREVRAEVTMIASQANNPLKFSPTVDVALAHLLGPGVRGFMPPEAAMRDAFNDLRAHQFGVMVGMRAALAHVIARFEPAELEKKIAAKSALDSLFAANRKAKLWDQFMALYAGIATEAEDDFHSLFGKAFLQAYEEQMARLKDAENR